MPNLIFVIVTLLLPIAEGRATRYDPGVMATVVKNRIEWGQLDLEKPHEGFIAVADCRYVGKTAWIGLPGGDLMGPYLVADCGRASDQEHLRNIGFAVDLSWELALQLGVVNAPLRGVTVYVRENRCQSMSIYARVADIRLR